MTSSHVYPLPIIRTRNAVHARAPMRLRSSTFAHHFSQEESLPQMQRGKLLREVCTWGIGGPAKLFCEVHHEVQLASVISYCARQHIRFLVIGKGSNCLFDDQGFDGCIILNRIGFFERRASGVYHVGSGYPFNVLGVQCSNDGYTGLEFASGIPGTVGGAVCMNAAANGQKESHQSVGKIRETAGVLKSVEVVTVDGNKHQMQRAELLYGYRSSPFQMTQGSAAISSATFALAPSSTSKERLREFLERRKQTQPLAERTAGCVFKNPGSGCQSAGSLIEKAGLKGLSVGAAKVSEIHANFLVNSKDSQAKDMMDLILLVKEQVKLKLGVDLEQEIIYVPFR